MKNLKNKIIEKLKLYSLNASAHFVVFVAVLIVAIDQTLPRFIVSAILLAFAGWVYTKTEIMIRRWR